MAGAHPAQDHGGHLQPVLDGPPAELVAPVVAAREEGREGVGVGHVQLDGVEARLADASGGVAIGRDDLVDLSAREVLHLLPPAGARDLEEMDDLRGHPGGGAGVHSVHQAAQAGHVLAVAGAQQRAALGGVHAHGLDDHESRLAPGVAQVAIVDRVVDHSILPAQAGHHGGQDDAVFELQAAKFHRREEQRALRRKHHRLKSVPGAVSVPSSARRVASGRVSPQTRTTVLRVSMYSCATADESRVFKPTEMA